MTQLTLEQAFELALKHHQAGRVQEAGTLYQLIIAQHPRPGDAMHSLGLRAHQAGYRDIAVDLIGRAIGLDPNLAEAYSNLGVILKECGRVDEAIIACHQAIRLKPNFAEAQCNLGNALTVKGDLDQAIAAYRRAVAMKPGYANAYSGLGNALRENDQLDEAVTACRHAIALRPDLAGAHNNLGNALREKGLIDEAISACRQAVALNPALAEAHNNLANALSENARFDEAITAARQAIALNPRFAIAHNNLGLALQQLLRLDEAAAAHRQAIALAPDFANAHFNLACLLLLRGELFEGWKEYEWRLSDEKPSVIRPRDVRTQWDGSDLTGRTILLHTEQGFGDALQLCRYIPLLAERAGKIVVDCPPALRRILQSLPDVGHRLIFSEPLPPIDFQCPLPTFPLIFGTTLQSIPCSAPYLHADSDSITHWQKKLAGDQNHLKVGLAWAGRPTPKYRSIPPAALAPLGKLSGVSFYSLQKATAGGAQPNLPAGLDLIDLTDDLQDFADTAALMANLDLVISIDSAVAHLAGAMGKPVWTLLKFLPDWRWLLDRDDSPWYPTMRLFRQSRIGDWDTVIREVTRALAESPPGWKA